MTEPSHITAHATDAAHVSEGLALLTQQLKGKPAIEALLSTWLDQVQLVEDALWSLYALTITSSSAAALDQLGVILGQPRPADMLDAPYRLVLAAVVIALRSSGTGEDLLNAARALLGSWDFTLTETYPAAVLIEPDAAPSVPSVVMLAILKRVKSAGVGLQLVDVPEGDLFRFAAGEVPETDADHGFSDVDGLTGGLLVGVLT